jgi:ABC-2 type transport system permease protein
VEKQEETMNNLGLIINREYTSRVKKKSFLLLTILVPLLAVGFMFGAIWLTLEKDKKVNVLISDPAGWCNAQIYQNPNDNTNKNIEFSFYENYIDSVDIFMNGEQFQDYDILVSLTEKVPTSRRVPVFYRDQPSLKTEHYIQNRVESRLMEYFALKKTNISKDQYREIKQSFDFRFLDGTDPTGTDYSSEQAGVGFAFAILTYMFIFIYSMQVMRGVIEEKTNRVIEVLISSVKPFQLMMGKIIGIGLVGLTQFLIWLILSGIGMMVLRLFVFKDMTDPGNWSADAMNNGLVESNLGAQSSELAYLFYEGINWPLMLSSFVIYFIGGFLLYSAIFAAIGAMVDSETDTQQLVLPVTAPLILGYIVATMMISNPSSEIGTWFSMIPFTSPVVMMVRIAQGTLEGEFWQYIVSVVLLFGTFLATTWFAAKIYRIGILMYGKKASWKEVIKWIKYK